LTPGQPREATNRIDAALTGWRSRSQAASPIRSRCGRRRYPSACGRQSPQARRPSPSGVAGQCPPEPGSPVGYMGKQRQRAPHMPISGSRSHDLSPILTPVSRAPLWRRVSLAHDQPQFVAARESVGGTA
jgi:hypothetical protein